MPSAATITRVTTSLITFFAASLLLALFPGPGTALVLRQAVRGGRKAALATVIGMELGVLVWALAAAFGVSVLLTASEIAYTTLRIIGVIVLVWIGIRSLLHARRPDTGPAQAPSTAQGVRAGLLVNVANPKLGVFAVSFLPQFVAPGPGHQSTLVVLALLWVVVDTLWYLVVVVLLDRISRFLQRAKVRKRLEQVSGTVLIGLGVRLALDSSR
ncbi:threonine/homoserine/homoserine lactone efflux protein [Labedaea rhizosphaerae]|uniref:Threonine/homoserine/homoserine lactone efflux protein n=1 Tax=Labedaea rhizosphaerae TaxID=598644 RepID=A0A4R6SKG6_LABRH|nr:threonine/homoserine/homoserine lactone efflux protein [Labedaea rhizosphaerae]